MLAGMIVAVVCLSFLALLETIRAIYRTGTWLDYTGLPDEWELGASAFAAMFVALLCAVALIAASVSLDHLVVNG